MKLTLPVLFTICLLFAIIHATEGGPTVITQKRELPAFSSISLSGVSTVKIHKGPQEVLLTIDSNKANRYVTTVKDNRLYLGFKCNSLSAWWDLVNLKTCEVNITVPDLDGMAVSGAGRIITDDFLFDKLELKVDGTGEIKIQGIASELNVSCTGSGKVFSRNLRSNCGTINLIGASSVEVNIVEFMIVNIKGAGKLVYHGNPKIEKRISGAGEMRKADNNGE